MKPKTKRATPKPARRQTLAKLIASAPTLRDKAKLAALGADPDRRFAPAQSIALYFQALRHQAACKQQPAGDYGAVLHNGEPVKILRREDDFARLCKLARDALARYTFEALRSNRPEQLEALARAMRQAERGDFDIQPDRDRLELLARAIAGELNVAALARETAGHPGTLPDADAAESKERHLRRLKKEMRI
jgi:hypothetical protein